MRTPHRDRRGPALVACCAALVIAILIAPCAALYAEYRVLPNGTVYNASIEVTGVDRFDFYELGVLGERVPVKAADIRLSGNCSPCMFNMSGTSAISFMKGNYTISYTAPLREYHLQAIFDEPYKVNISIPEGFDVRNPLIAGISPGGTISDGPDNSTIVTWKQTTTTDLRFYDKNRETILYLFGNFWIIIAIVLLVPFFLTMRKRE